MSRLPPFGLEHISDSSAVAWIAERLRPWSDSPKVGDVMPEGFERYARLLHPAHEGGIPVRWSRVAEWSGRELHPTIDFRELATRENGDRWPSDFDPQEELERSLCAHLAGILGDFTSTPSVSWYCVWSGYGGMQVDQPEIEIRRDITRSGRTYYLFRGPVEGVTNLTFIEGTPLWGLDTEFDGPKKTMPEPEWHGFHSPNLWWPDDRTWFVSTEIDGPSTYIGGSAQLIERLLADPQLEVLPASLDDPFEGVPDPNGGP